MGWFTTRWRPQAIACILIAVAPAVARPLPANSAQANRIVVLEHGIYWAETAGISGASNADRYVYQVQHSKLLRSTTSIPARRWVRFGLRYMVVGAPAGATVRLRMITRYPPSGILDPETRKRTFRHEYTVNAVIGGVSYRDYHFDHAWEIVPGRWIFEFWQGERKLGEQEFCVTDHDHALPTTARGCTALTG